MKVLHAITINGFGGAEKLLLQLLPALKRTGASVECLILYKAGNPTAALTIGKELETNNIPVVYHAYHAIWSRRIRMAIRTTVGKGDFDLVHSHLKYTDFLLAWLKRSGQLKTPVISTLHGYSDNYENRFGFRIDRSIYFSWYYWLTRFIYKWLDGFVMISQVVDRFYEAVKMLKNKKKKIIYHGYNVGGMSPVTRQDPPMKQGPRIAIAGRLLKRKGHYYALDAFEKLLRDFPNASLHIYGDGPLRNQLESVVQQKKLNTSVQFHGYVSNIIEHLKICHIVLVPSLWEGFGIAFLDAFAAGTPVVAFDLPAGNEIIANGVDGLLAEPYNSDSLYEKMKLLAESPLLREKIRTMAYQKLTRNFTIEKMATNYLNFYHQLGVN